jgi:hypothetical protein
MQQRDLMKAIAGSAVLWPLAARAQSEPTRRVGVLTGRATDAESLTWIERYFHFKGPTLPDIFPF